MNYRKSRVSAIKPKHTNITEVKSLASNECTYLFVTNILGSPDNDAIIIDDFVATVLFS